MSDYDVVIVGAGAAGLAAAVEIANAGRTVCVLEARERVGGRIHTRLDAHVAVPLELGAELIHGRAPLVMQWLQRAQVAAIDATQSRWTLRNGRLQPGTALFEQMRRGLAAVRKPRRDLPFADFLEGPARRRLRKPVREFARLLVEGFDAADATRVSTLETLAEWAGQSAADAPTFRPAGGYAALLSALLQALSPRVRLQLNTAVQRIEWRRGAVTVHAVQSSRALKFTAAQAVLTVPLSVLQDAQAIRFDPPLTRKQPALAQLAMGPALKVLLQFRTAFWETLDDGRYRDGAFFHAPGAAFPTFWTLLPLRAPVLSAWTAGPAAARLSRLDDDALIDRALSSAAVVFGRRAPVRAEFLSASLHNWQRDPFAGGAYSYVLAGGAGARRQLAKPLSGTLFFAGEATAAEAATVAGALQSGMRVSGEVLKNY